MESNRLSEDQFPVSENEKNDLDVPNQQSNLEKGLDDSEIGPNDLRESVIRNDTTADTHKKDDFVYGSQASDDKQTPFNRTEFKADEDNKTTTDPQEREYTAYTGSDNQTVQRSEYNNLTPENEDESAIEENHFQNEASATKSDLAKNITETVENGDWVKISAEDKTELPGEIKQKTETVSKHTQEQEDATEPGISKETKSTIESNAAGQEGLKQSLDENKSRGFASKDDARDSIEMVSELKTLKFSQDAEMMEVDQSDDSDQQQKQPRFDWSDHASEEVQTYIHNDLDESGPNSPTSDPEKMETETPWCEQKCCNCLSLDKVREELRRVSDENATLKRTQEENVKVLIRVSDENVKLNRTQEENKQLIQSLVDENGKNIEQINRTKSENARYKKDIDRQEGQIIRMKKENERQEGQIIQMRKENERKLSTERDKVQNVKKSLTEEKEKTSKLQQMRKEMSQQHKDWCNRKETEHKNKLETTAREYKQKMDQQDREHKQYQQDAKKQEEYWKAKNESLEDKIRAQEKKLEDLLLRYSKLAGESLTIGNANVTDLSDPQRPTKLAEQFSELYDNQWTDAFEEIANMDDNEKIKFLLDILQRAYSLCIEITSTEWLSQYNYTTYKNCTDAGTETCWEEIEISEASEGRKDTEKLTEKSDGIIESDQYHEPTADDLLKQIKPKPIKDDTLQQNNHEPTADALLKRNNHEPIKDDSLQQNEQTEDEDDSLQKKHHKAAEEGSEQQNNNEPTEEGLKQKTNRDSTEEDSLQKEINEPTMEDAFHKNTHETTEEDSLQKKKHESTKEELIQQNKHELTDEERLQKNKHESTEEDFSTSVDPEDKVSPEGTSVDPDVAITGTKNNITRREIIRCIEVPEEISETESESVKNSIKIFTHTRKKVLSKASSDIQKVIIRCLQEEFHIPFEENTAIIEYVNKCTELCLRMGLKDPPLFIDFMKSDRPEKHLLAPDRYKAYTKKGKYIEFLVWPCLYLEEGGSRPLLSKGIAQGTD